MFCRVFLVAALLTCSGESSVQAFPQTVQAFVGGVVVLPCSHGISAGDEFPTVEWSKEGLHPNVVFLYRDGSETYEMKNEAFEFRTSLIPKELKNRNISLRISDVRLSDAGTYTCMRLWRNAPRDITTVQLFVGALSEPRLSLVSAESGGVTLQCEAACWLPEPEITFLDPLGKEIPAEEPKRDQDAGGCFTVTRRLVLQQDTRRVTCRVSQLEMNQTRTTEILIPENCMNTCSLTFVLVVIETVLLILATCALTALFLKRFFFKSGPYKQPLKRKSSGNSKDCVHDKEPFLHEVRVQDGVMKNNSIREKPREEAAHMLTPKSISSQPLKIANAMRQTRRSRINSNPEVVTCPLSSSSPPVSCSKSVHSIDSGLPSEPLTRLGPSVPDLKQRRWSILPSSTGNGFGRSLDFPGGSQQTFM